MTEPREPTDQLGIGAADMTDRTPPEALRLADEFDWWLARGITIEPRLYDAATELRRQHARIAELEAQLESIGAGGVSGPLMGRASLAASAGSEPVASDGWLHQDGLLYRLTDERRPCNRDEINVTMADGLRSIESRSRRALELLDRIRATYPSPPEGMAGWKLVPIEPTAEMKAAAVKYANGTAVYKNVKAEVLRIEEGIYGEVYEAMIAAAPQPHASEAKEL